MNKESSTDRALFFWPGVLAAHYFIAVAGAMLIGFLPEVLISPLYHTTSLEPYTPAIAICALLLGYLASPRILNGDGATLVWLLGTLWLFVGAYELTSGWSVNGHPVNAGWGPALDGLFSTDRCSDSECLYEFFFTTPFVASVMYSIGALLRKRKVQTVPKAPK
jgi:hypothetical protein